MADDWSIELAATQRLTPTAVIGAVSASASGSEYWRYGVEQQQAARGTGNPEADASV